MKRKLNKKRFISDIILFGIFGISILYILALLKIILFKYGFDGGIRGLNLKPFEFITEYSWNKKNIVVVLKNVLGNLLLFIPLGILVPTLFKKVNFKNTILICFGVSLAFEIIQYVFSLGASDVDDLILNTFGGFLGLLIYFMCLKKIDNKAKMKIATLGFLGIFGICGLIVLYIYHPSALPNSVYFLIKRCCEGI